MHFNFYVGWCITLFSCMVVFTLYLAYDMDLHYLTFMGRNLENKKRLMLMQIMNNVGMNSENIVIVVGIFNDNALMNIFNE